MNPLEQVASGSLLILFYSISIYAPIVPVDWPMTPYYH